MHLLILLSALLHLISVCLSSWPKGQIIVTSFFLCTTEAYVCCVWFIQLNNQLRMTKPLDMQKHSLER